MLSRAMGKLASHLWAAKGVYGLTLNPSIAEDTFIQRTRIRDLAAYASSMSFGHPEHCFLTVRTPKNKIEDVEAVVSLL